MTLTPWFRIISRHGFKENNDFERAGDANDIVQSYVLQMFDEIVARGVSFHATFMQQRRHHHDSTSFREANSMKAMIRVIQESKTCSSIAFSMKVRDPWCTLHPHHKKKIVVLIENVVPSVSRLKKTEHKCSQGKHGMLNLDGPGLAKKIFDIKRD